MRISPNFKLEELTRSQTASRMGRPVTVDPESTVAANLERLCYMALEPARALVNKPIVITSGYRPKYLNDAIGGSQTSEHLDGRAADFYVIGMELSEAFAVLRDSDIPYNQLIIEHNSWIHMSIPKPLTPPKRQRLMASGDRNNPTWKAA